MWMRVVHGGVVHRGEDAKLFVSRREGNVEKMVEVPLYTIYVRTIAVNLGTDKVGKDT